MLYKTFLIGLISLNVSVNAYSRPSLDFDGDGMTDLVVFDSTSNATGSLLFWHILGGRAGYSITQWGAFSNESTDSPASADYDGDGKTDIAIWRKPQPNVLATQCYYYIIYSSTNTFGVIPWGSKARDIEVNGDYDGDGKVDPAISRRTGNDVWWWILQSRDGIRVERWGGANGSGDLPVPGDYDGDGKTDLAIMRYTPPNTPPPPFTWFILKSSDGNWIVKQLGYNGVDRPYLGDYDGDGKTDIAVVGNYNWQWIRSSDGQNGAIHWGGSLDSIVPGDYDGDGITDQAVYRPNLDCSESSKFVINGSRSGLQVIRFGGCNHSAGRTFNTPKAESFEGYKVHSNLK